jgi:damage-control phosphatase, subfamily III
MRCLKLTNLAPCHTSDETSFAYISAKDRWPVILTGAIDDVHRAVSESHGEAKVKEGKTIVESIAKLKYELQHNRTLTPLPGDGQPDIDGYNEELKALGTPTWFNLPWLYGECYLYRQV